MRRDLHNWIKPATNLNITDFSIASSSVNGAIVDTQGYSILEFLFFSSVFTQGSLTPSFVWGNQANLSDGVAVDAQHLIGTISGATFTSADEDATKKIGIYLTTYRYVRMTLTPQPGATEARIGVTSVLSAPYLMPTT